MSDAAPTSSIKPQNPTNASEAAKLILERLPRVKDPKDGRFYYGYYKNDVPVFIPSTLDRALVTGTLQGIAEGRVAQGDKSLVGSLMQAFVRPIESAITEAKSAAQQSAPQQFSDQSTSREPVAPNAATQSSEPPLPLKTAAETRDVTENQKLLNALFSGVDWAASFGIFTDQALKVNHKAMGFSAQVRG